MVVNLTMFTIICSIIIGFMLLLINCWLTSIIIMSLKIVWISYYLCLLLWYLCYCLYYYLIMRCLLSTIQAYLHYILYLNDIIYLLMLSYEVFQINYSGVIAFTISVLLLSLITVKNNMNNVNLILIVLLILIVINLTYLGYIVADVPYIIGSSWITFICFTLIVCIML